MDQKPILGADAGIIAHHNAKHGVSEQIRPKFEDISKSYS